MLIKMTTIAGATLLLLASTAHAQTGTATTPSPAASPAPEAAPSPSKAEAGKAAGVEEKDRIVCRSVRTTGSRFPTRVCETKGTMAKKGEEMRRQAEKINEKTKNTLQRRTLSF